MVDLINKTKNDVVAFDSLEDYVYNAMLQEQSNHKSFNLFSLKDWIFLLTSLVAIVALGLSILLYCKIRTILILLGTMQKFSDACHRVNRYRSRKCKTV